VNFPNWIVNSNWKECYVNLFINVNHYFINGINAVIRRHLIALSEPKLEPASILQIRPDIGFLPSVRAA
jgi:hypothetical protein